MFLIKSTLSLIWIGIIVLNLLVLYDLYSWLEHRLGTFTYLFYGMGSYIVFKIVVPKNSMLFFDVFFHELSHSIFALLTFSPLKAFVVTPHEGSSTLGYVEHTISGNTFTRIIREHLVSLAPYFFAPLTVVTIGIYYLLIPFGFAYLETINILLGVIGFTYLYHLSVSLRDFHPYQSDFNFLGYRYSMLFVIMMQLIFLILFITVLNINTDGFSKIIFLLEIRVNDIFYTLTQIQNKLLYY